MKTVIALIAFSLFSLPAHAFLSSPPNGATGGSGPSGASGASGKTGQTGNTGPGGTTINSVADGSQSSTVQGQTLVNTAAGLNAFAGGRGTVASGDASFAVGSASTASGPYSATFGHANATSAYAGVTFGDSNNNAGNYMLMGGAGNSGNGTGGVCLGGNNICNGSQSFAAGATNTTTGGNSIAIGTSNNMAKDNSGAIGTSNLVTGAGGVGIAIGNQCTTGGNTSICIGNTLTALDGATIMGDNNASGMVSFDYNSFSGSYASGYRLAFGTATTGLWITPGSGSTFGGDIRMTSPGAIYRVSSSGSAASAGIVTLSGGTATVNTTAVGGVGTSNILMTEQTSSGTVGGVYVFSRSSGASFTIKSLNVLDTSQVGWEIHNLQ